MILEIVTWDIKPGQTKAFENAFEQAQTLLSKAKGYRSHQFHRCVEKPDRYVLLVNWETLEDHTEGFRGSADYQRYRELISPYYEAGATLQHYEPLFDHAR